MKIRIQRLDDLDNLYNILSDNPKIRKLLKNNKDLWNNFIDYINESYINGELYPSDLEYIFINFRSKFNVEHLLKEDYTNTGFAKKVRDIIIEILENPYDDIFDLGMCSEVILTGLNEDRAEITEDGNIHIDYLTFPIYASTSGYRPQNKELENYFEYTTEKNYEIARERLWYNYKDELIKIGITSEDDEKLNYTDLFEMGEEDLAEKLSEYELDFESEDPTYTNVDCKLEEVARGIELTISMNVSNGYVVVVDSYKPNTVILREDDNDLRKTIEDAIKKVTYQF